MIVREALDAFITKRVFKQDRTKTVGASEVGTCARRVWYAKQSHEKDASYVDRWGATERGNLIENKLWEPALKKKYKGKLKFSGPKQKSFKDGPISATPDGLLFVPRDALKYLDIKDIESDCVILECKSIDPRVDLKEARHHHIMQAQAQLGAVRATTKYKPVYAIISYLDASFLDNITEFPVKFDQTLYDGARKRSGFILGADAATDLQPEGWIAGGKECEHCPHLQACGIERRNLPSEKFKPAEVDMQFRVEIEDMVREAVGHQKSSKAHDIAYRTAQDAIKTRLRDKQIRKIPGLVSWADVKARDIWDYDGLKLAATTNGVDIDKFKSSGEPGDRLTLTAQEKS
jgi:hypothetical protein